MHKLTFNFAPYQEIPDRARALSPPIPRRSLSYTPPPTSPRPPISTIPSYQNPWPPQPSPLPPQPPSPRKSALDYFNPNKYGTPRPQLDDFQTSLGSRVDYEACLAYACFPPFGAFVLLQIEKNSDYVRFHAWQSGMLFTLFLFFHVCFSSWYIHWPFMFLTVCFVELAAIGFLIMRAYEDADNLDRFEVPYIGAACGRLVDNEI